MYTAEKSVMRLKDLDIRSVARAGEIKAQKGGVRGLEKGLLIVHLKHWHS